MATPMTADRLLQALRDEGLTVVQVGDWRTHNRNHKGQWGPVHGVMIHHTVTKGTANTVKICRDGYEALPGPLCHGVIAKDGTVHLVGYGRANHAGLGDDDVLRAVIDEKPLPADDETNTDGNRHFYGFECENLGDGQDPWPAVQLEAIEKAAAAICRVHLWTERAVIGHLEWQPGKVDPRGFTMASMRARIADRLTVDEPLNPTPATAPQETPMSTVITEINPTDTELPADGAWLDIALVDAVLVGPGEGFAVTLGVQIAGLQQHADVETRFYYRSQATGDRSNFLPKTHPVVHITDDDGETVEFNTLFVEHSLAHKVPLGWDLRVQVRAKNPRGEAVARILHRTLNGLRGL